MPSAPGLIADRRDVAPADDARRASITNSARSLVPVLRAVDAVRARDLALRLEVGQQREAQVALLREREVAPDAVDRDAEQLGVEALELGQDLVVERHLVAADRAPVRGIETPGSRARPRSEESATVSSGPERSSKSGAVVSAGNARVSCSIFMAITAQSQNPGLALIAATPYDDVPGSRTSMPAWITPWATWSVPAAAVRRQARRPARRVVDAPGRLVVRARAGDASIPSRPASPRPSGPTTAPCPARRSRSGAAFSSRCAGRTTSTGPAGHRRPWRPTTASTACRCSAAGPQRRQTGPGGRGAVGLRGRAPARRADARSERRLDGEPHPRPASGRWTRTRTTSARRCSGTTTT